MNAMAEQPHVVDRGEAKELGLRFYFPTKPCGKGHLTAHYVSNRRCIACSEENSRKWREENVDKKRAYDQAHWRNNLEKNRADARARRSNNREREIKRCREWYIENRARVSAERKARRAETKEKERESRRAYYLANSERICARARAWSKANPDKRRAQHANRRARKNSSPGSHTAADVAALRKRQKERCAYCRTKLNGGGHLDHIVSLSKGGSNLPRNLQWLCEPCNLSKNSRDPVNFARSIGRLI